MCLNEILEVLSSLSVITASCVGVWGIIKWRKEIRFKRRHKLAEFILANAYEAVDIIQIIRFPASKKEEGKSRKPQESETPQQTEILNGLYVIKERYLENIECFKKLFSIRYNIKAVMNEEIERNLCVILNMPHKIFNIVDEYTDVKLNPENYSDNERIKITKKYNETVFADLSKERKDPIAEEINNALKKIEKECKKILG
jgi:hypothetical protein